MLQFEHVYFTDIILFTIRLLVVPAPSTTGDTELTSISMETLSSIIYRVGHMNASGTLFPTLLISSNFTAQPPFDPSTSSTTFFRSISRSRVKSHQFINQLC